MISWPAFLTIIIVAGAIFSLAWKKRSPDVVMVTCLLVCIITGILSPEEAMRGFANPSLLALACLYVVVAALESSGSLRMLGDWLVRSKGGAFPTLQSRLLPLAGIASAFINNTPVVAAMSGVARDWANRYGSSVSHLLMPLSFAAILGGTCSLTGSSTNVVVSQMLSKATGGEGLAMFELAPLGVPLACLGMVYLLVFSSRLLPQRSSSEEQTSDIKEYTAELEVEEESPLIGRSIEEAGLRSLSSLYLAEIVRDSGEVLRAVSPQRRLQVGDRLLLVGDVNGVRELRELTGLRSPVSRGMPSGRCDSTGLVEAVLSPSSPVIGYTVKESNFRSLYNAAIWAISRDGKRLSGKIGNMVLQAGDTLLLEAEDSFEEKYRYSREFLLLRKLSQSRVWPQDTSRARLAIAVTVGMVVVLAAGWMDLVAASSAAMLVLLSTRCISSREARRSIDYPVLFTLGSAFALATAMEKTGLAEAFGSFLVELSGSDAQLALLSIYVSTALFTELLNNNAAAIMMFPLATSICDTLGVDLRPFAVAVAIAASASFLSPMGYQTNLMVYGPGGYHYGDYARLGVPLSILVALVSLTLIPMIWPL